MGCYLYTMQFKAYPFDHKRVIYCEKFKKLEEGFKAHQIISTPVLTPEILSDFDEFFLHKDITFDFKDLILRMLNPDPVHRINIEDILTHRWTRPSQEESKESGPRDKSKPSKEAIEKEIREMQNIFDGNMRLYRHKPIKFSATSGEEFKGTDDFDIEDEGEKLELENIIIQKYDPLEFSL